MIILPEHGRVADDRVFEGDQYARYSPHLLEELPPKRAETTIAVKPASIAQPPKPEAPKAPEVVEPRPTLPPQKVVSANIIADTNQKLASASKALSSVDDALDQAEATVNQQQRRRRGRPKKVR
jgi:hypothetical protein